MENIFTIQAEKRVEKGKKISKQLRKNGKLPAIIYGGNVESLPVAVTVEDIKQVIKSESGENSILRIVAGEDSQQDAMIKEIQYDYLSSDIIHLDFIRIDLTKPVEVHVPVVLEGTPIGVKMEDGLLDFVTREVHVRCLPAKIPRMFKLDISQLHSGHSLKVEDLQKDDDVQFTSSMNTVICAVISKTKEEEHEVEATTEEEGVAPATAAEPVAESE